jgi:hypothetical protein
MDETQVQLLAGATKKKLTHGLILLIIHYVSASHLVTFRY